MTDSIELKNLMDADQYSKFCEEEDAKHWLTLIMKELLSTSHCGIVSRMITINQWIWMVQSGGHFFRYILIQTCAALLLCLDSFKFTGYFWSWLREIIILVLHLIYVLALTVIINFSLAECTTDIYIQGDWLTYLLYIILCREKLVHHADSILLMPGKGFLVHVVL